jgi:hypothetical protein
MLQFTLHSFALALIADLRTVFFGMQTQPIDKFGLPEFFHPTGLEMLLSVWSKVVGIKTDGA